ncbi:hypothetical protein ACGGZK_04140 [Agromyces sp. MMS24-K17]|uniref:hypothetical protein n=1 Tax=Agromyces sp. MMS24-K17 TaxID=3372850 RepID=UPI0037546598
MTDAPADGVPVTDASPTRVRRLRREAWGFAIGSVAFFLGPLPFYAAWAGPVGTAATFFAGSIFFTTAGFIQLSLSGRKTLPRNMGRADRDDWWAAAVQFAGTLFFNLSTGAVLVAAVQAADDPSVGWRPDAWGSICFLVASGFALSATRARGELWDVDARTWHGTWLNAIGSVAFGVSAVGAYVLPQTGDLVSQFWANLGTVIGAICFFTAALLSRRSIPVPASPSAGGGARVA